jgi:centromere protein J
MSGFQFDQAFASLLKEDSPREYNPLAYEEEEEWGDLDSEFVCRVADSLPTAVKSKPVALEAPPTTSKVVQKYFGLQDKPKAAKLADSSIDHTAATDIVDSRVSELNLEIEKFKKLQEQLKREQLMTEEKHRQVTKEKQELDELQGQAALDVRRTLEETEQKWRQEVRVRERNLKALSHLPTKQARDEMDQLNDAITKLQSEIHGKETKHKLNLERLTSQVNKTRRRKEELQAEIELAKAVSADVVIKREVRRGLAESPRGKQSSPVVVPRGLAEPPKGKQSSPVVVPSSPEKGEAKPMVSKYISRQTENSVLIRQNPMQDGKLQLIFDDGRQEVLFPNGVRKAIYVNKYAETFYTNGDVKQEFTDGHVVYFYASAGTVHTVWPDGLQVICFNDGQIEKHYQDGSKKITFADGSVKRITAEGEEEMTYVDGVVRCVDCTGCTTVLYPGGHKDVSYDGHVVRYFVDGRSKPLA